MDNFRYYFTRNFSLIILIDNLNFVNSILNNHYNPVNQIMKKIKTR